MRYQRAVLQIRAIGHLIGVFGLVGNSQAWLFQTWLLVIFAWRRPFGTLLCTPLHSFAFLRLRSFPLICVFKAAYDHVQSNNSMKSFPPPISQEVEGFGANRGIRVNSVKFSESSRDAVEISGGILKEFPGLLAGFRADS